MNDIPKCAFRLANGHRCKRSTTEATTWGVFCWRHARPAYAIRHVQQAQASARIGGGTPSAEGDAKHE